MNRKRNPSPAKRRTPGTVLCEVHHPDGKVTLERIDPRLLERPQDGSYDGCKEAATWRIGANMRRTGHPFHHLTINGAIVDDDPTLRDMLAHISPDEWPSIPEPLPNAPTAIPCDHWYYGFNPYGNGYGLTEEEGTVWRR